jgi:hypothetical protein
MSLLCQPALSVRPGAHRGRPLIDLRSLCPGAIPDHNVPTAGVGGPQPLTVGRVRKLVAHGVQDRHDQGDVIDELVTGAADLLSVRERPDPLRARVMNAPLRRLRGCAIAKGTAVGDVPHSGVWPDREVSYLVAALTARSRSEKAGPCASAMRAIYSGLQGLGVDLVCVRCLRKIRCDEPLVSGHWDEDVTLLWGPEHRKCCAEASLVPEAEGKSGGGGTRTYIYAARRAAGFLSRNDIELPPLIGRALNEAGLHADLFAVATRLAAATVDAWVRSARRAEPNTPQPRLKDLRSRLYAARFAVEKLQGPRRGASRPVLDCWVRTT